MIHDSWYMMMKMIIMMMTMLVMLSDTSKWHLMHDTCYIMIHHDTQYSIWWYSDIAIYIYIDILIYWSIDILIYATEETRRWHVVFLLYDTYGDRMTMGVWRSRTEFLHRTIAGFYWLLDSTYWKPYLEQHLKGRSLAISCRFKASMRASLACSMRSKWPWMARMLTAGSAALLMCSAWFCDILVDPDLHQGTQTAARTFLQLELPSRRKRLWGMAWVLLQKHWLARVHRSCKLHRAITKSWPWERSTSNNSHGQIERFWKTPTECNRNKIPHRSWSTVHMNVATQSNLTYVWQMNLRFRSPVCANVPCHCNTGILELPALCFFACPCGCRADILSLTCSEWTPHVLHGCSTIKCWTTAEYQHVINDRLLNVL